MDQILTEVGKILPFPITLPTIFAVLQIILDLILIFIILFLLKRVSAFDTGKFEALIKTLKESHALCEQLNQTVAKNARIAGKIQTFIKEPERDGEEMVSTGAKEKVLVNEKVKNMWLTGATVDEISDATGLSKGEIEVMTSLIGQQ